MKITSFGMVKFVSAVFFFKFVVKLVLSSYGTDTLAVLPPTPHHPPAPTQLRHTLAPISFNMIIVKNILDLNPTHRPPLHWLGHQVCMQHRV